MRYVLLVSALAATCAAGPAAACGDKLAALAGGVRYERLHRSEHPSRIVFYLPAGSALLDGERSRSLAAELERAGHQVDIVGARESLDARLRAGVVDLVLTETNSATPGVSGAPVLLLRTGTTERTSSNELHGTCVATLGRRGARQLVRSVEAVLEQRSRGGAGACTATSVVSGT